VPGETLSVQLPPSGRAHPRNAAGSVARGRAMQSEKRSNIVRAPLQWGYPARAGRFAATQLRGRLPPTEELF